MLLPSYFTVTYCLIDYCFSAGPFHWSEPAQGICALVGHLGAGGFHAVSPHHRADAGDPRLHQWQEAEV